MPHDSKALVLLYGKGKDDFKRREGKSRDSSDSNETIDNKYKKRSNSMQTRNNTARNIV